MCVFILEMILYLSNQKSSNIIGPCKAVCILETQELKFLHVIPACFGCWNLHAEADDWVALAEVLVIINEFASLQKLR
jgi:hypothetical protein